MKIPYAIDLNTIIDQDNEIIDLFIFIFPYYLKKAMRKGLFKQYTRNEYNNNNIKGTIDIQRHIKNNTPFIGNIAYSQREFSYDNYMLQLIRHTIEFIKKRKEGAGVLSSIRNEAKEVREVTTSYNHMDRNKIIMFNNKRPIRHAYYKEYRELQKLCLTILQRHKHYIGNGKEKIHGILFDGAWLWEEYIDTLVSADFYHPKNKGGSGSQRLFSSHLGSKIGLVYPDFIGCNQENRIIGDAKYKPIQNIGNRDYLQVLAYMLRFDSKTGYYFYPNHKETRDEVLYLNQEISYERNVQMREEIKVTKLGLAIPKEVENYKDFSKKMKKAEQAFLAKI
ncbi:McrC family protein [Staphylococcus xylosus]|uniref:McrC family protein n=1 Tax=Staphylococcus xylosus TaxID=1288 RepID=UPI002174E815|nr:McrC family protein [Staphylococcus xylosus]